MLWCELCEMDVSFQPSSTSSPFAFVSSSPAPPSPISFIFGGLGRFRKISSLNKTVPAQPLWFQCETNNVSNAQLFSLLGNGREWKRRGRVISSWCSIDKWFCIKLEPSPLMNVQTPSFEYLGRCSANLQDVVFPGPAWGHLSVCLRVQQRRCRMCWAAGVLVPPAGLVQFKGAPDRSRKAGAGAAQSRGHSLNLFVTLFSPFVKWGIMPLPS